MRRTIFSALRPLITGTAALAALTLPHLALGAGASLKADLIEAKSIKLDGIPKEWSNLVSLGHAIKGKAQKPDLEASAGVVYDANNIYVAADVTDDTLRGGGGDRVELVLGFPGGAVHTISLYPGEPGKSAATAKTKDGTAVRGAKVIEAPRAGGWSIEASIPWSTFPEAKVVRVGLRGALVVHDADSGKDAKNIVGTASSLAYASLPSISTETEQSLADGLVKQKGLRGAPLYNLLADVAGDAMKERVLVYDRYLVVLGSNFRGGTQYYWSDLGVDAAHGMLPSCEVRDLTGDGQSEIILRKRFGTQARFREMMQVLRFVSADVPTTVFQHETGLTSEAGSIANEVSLVPDGGKVAIRLTPGTAKGFNAGNYHETTETSFDPLLLPWGTVASQTYTWSTGVFLKTKEETQSATPPPASPQPVSPSLPKAPPPPSPGELLEQVYDLYKKDRGATGRPRFDLGIDVDGDKSVERVLLHERDIVIFGKGFKGGTGYSFLNLAQFASPRDILEMSARDVTGDGKAEIIIKGIIHASAPKEAGGGTVDREVVMVFQVSNTALRRVFAAETARAMGKKRVSGAIKFVNAGKGVEIELGPGSAVEWTDKTYPFNQDQGPVGGFEPLLLPWGGNKPVRYRWKGTAFSR